MGARPNRNFIILLSDHNNGSVISFHCKEGIESIMETQMDADFSKCSSCPGNEKEVKIFSAGPRYYLCDKCLEVCLQIAAELEKNSENICMPQIKGPQL
jgi:hypothetical protein